ncbi:hypothetical protein V8D89_005736 [Ganoderma adspersum]
MSPNSENLFNLLNNDVLLQIFEELRLAKCLSSFSVVSRWTREAVMPTLFSVCYQGLQYPATARDVIPESLWPYVRTLHLKCVCPPLRAFSYTVYDPAAPPTDPVVCGAFHHRLTEVAVRQIPLLTEVVFDNCKYIAVHGLTWRTIRAMLTIPNLRHFAIHSLRICPTTHDNIEWGDSQPSTLSSFRYRVRDPTPTRSFLAEERALDTVVRTFHTSLSTLVLPTEPAPIQLMCSLAWPRLRELRLRGLRWTTPSTPIITLFACMPHLRTFALQLYEPEHIEARAVWPRGFSAVYPWPELEHLQISHPDEDDELYAHLPPTLRGLVLRSWPHICIQIKNNMRYTQQELRWNFPPTSASALLRILRRCRAPGLRTLELEYVVDEPGAEAELLRHVAASFPRLDMLELHRYRNGDPIVPTEEVAQHLAPLADLAMIKLHLDFPNTPPPAFSSIDERRYCHDKALDAYDVTLASTAITFANVLSPALQEIWVLRYAAYHGPIWAVFSVARADPEGDAGPQATAQRQRDRLYLGRP